MTRSFPMSNSMKMVFSFCAKIVIQTKEVFLTKSVFKMFRCPLSNKDILFGKYVIFLERSMQDILKDEKRGSIVFKSLDIITILVFRVSSWTIIINRCQKNGLVVVMVERLDSISYHKAVVLSKIVLNNHVTLNNVVLLLFKILSLLVCDVGMKS